MMAARPVDVRVRMAVVVVGSLAVRVAAMTVWVRIVFLRLLHELAPDEEKFYAEGAEEVEAEIGKSK